MPSYQYRDPHVKDKTVSPTLSSLTWESPYLGKTVFILKRGPGSLHHQIIIIHCLDHTQVTGPCLPWGRISTTPAISVLKNGKIWENIHTIPKMISAWQGLRPVISSWSDDLCVHFSLLIESFLVLIMTFDNDLMFIWHQHLSKYWFMITSP